MGRKWNNIKDKKAGQDKARGQIYTKILKEFECDTFFPIIPKNDYFLDESYHKDETIIEDNVPYKFLLYRRKRAQNCWYGI